MTKIHHATAKKAAANDIELIIDGDTIIAKDADGNVLCRGDVAKDVLDQAIQNAEAGEYEEPEDDVDPSADGELSEEDDSDADQSRSVVKAKYKAQYRPFKHRCGDDLSERINSHVVRENDAGEMRVNRKALERFARANGCWSPVYAGLRDRFGNWNAGMARMNIANRLRAKLRHAEKAGEVFEIQWV